MDAKPVWTAHEIGTSGFADACDIYALVEGGREIAIGPRERICLMAAAPVLLEAIRQIAGYTPDSTIQPVAIARVACEKLNIPWRSAAMAKVQS